MDRGFAGIVAVAVLGGAVILAIAFQISEGLEVEANRHGGAGPGGESEQAPKDGGLVSGAAPTADLSSASAIAGALNEESGPEHDAAEIPPTAESGIDQTEELTSAAAQSRNMPRGRQGTPTPGKEINPAEGHTVSPQPADEIEERARKGPLRRNSETRVPNVTSNDPNTPRAPVSAAPNAVAGETAPEPGPAIEMIRGTRRSSEPIAASENEN